MSSATTSSIKAISLQQSKAAKKWRFSGGYVGEKRRQSDDPFFLLLKEGSKT